MAGDRPGSGQPEDGAEFGWLYGKKQPDSGQPAPEPPPEATRMIPVQPRPSAPRPEPTAVRRTTPPQPPQPAPSPAYGQPSPPPPPSPAPTPGGGAGGGAGPGAGRSWFARFWLRRVTNPFWYVRFVLLLVLIWIVYTVAVPFITWQGNDQVAFEPSGKRPDDQSGTTYLLVGSDSRAGLTKAERRKYSTGNSGSALTDTIMLLHTGDGPSVLLSIPRDAFIPQKGYDDTTKINSAYAHGGPKFLVKTLENATGIRIDQYVEIGLGGLADVVDAVGGIEVCPKKGIKDPLAGLKIKKGCQDVDGKVALAYSRTRHESQLGDLERVQRQREVVAAIGHRVLSPWTVVNPVRWWRLNHAVPSFFTFGEGMSKVQAGRWALAMSRVGGSGRTCTLPVNLTDVTGDGLADVVVDDDRADQMYTAISEDRTDDITDKLCTAAGVAS